MSAPDALCRDCLARFPGGRRCPSCGSPRILQHPEIDTLSIAHLDCDAFYASVEKRDDPSLRDRPVIVGGGRRGVVTTACYIARIDGVRSAMPMFKALKLCPQAVVVKPRMDHYISVSRQIRALMLDLTPLVEPLSLDEAFLDLSGTQRLHHAPPAVLMARLQNRIESEIGIPVSVGLSHNKFLAKIASDLDKPRGFAVIGRAETLDFLSEKPVSLIWGVGRAGTESLARDGIRTFADLRRPDRKALNARYGSMGERLWHLARGIDTRPVSPHRAPKSISTETTFDTDIADPESLARTLWRLCERVSARAKSAGLGGTTVTLKLKRADFSLLTRRHALSEPTQMADRLYRAALPLLHRDMERAPFRLIGIGLSDLSDAAQADPSTDLLDPSEARDWPRSAPPTGFALDMVPNRSCLADHCAEGPASAPIRRFFVQASK
jgi:DNA polymerase IV